MTRTDRRGGERAPIIGRLPARVALLSGLLFSSAVTATVMDHPAARPLDPTIRQARALLAEGKLAEARTLLQQRLESDPNAVAIRLLLGNSYLADQPELARAAAMAVLAGGTRNRQALDLLTTAYSETRAAGLPQADEVHLRGLEIHDYSSLLERNPNWRDLLFRIATQRLDLQRLLPVDDVTRRDGQLAAAVAELTLLVGLFDAQHDSPIERASALYQLGRALELAADFLAEGDQERERRALLYERAHDALERAFEIDPGRVDAVAELARVALARADTQAAIGVIESRISKVPSMQGRAKLQALLGDLYLQAGRSDEALDVFNTAIETDKGLLDAYLGLYRIHRLREDPQQAERVMSAAVSAEPGFVLGHLKLGELDAERGDYAGAIESFERALAVPPQSALVLGMAPSRNAYRSGLYYQAAAWLAWLYLEHGNDPERALAAVERAEQFRPIDAPLADTQGWIYYHLGDYERARDILDAAAKTSGDFPALHYHLARTYLALGERDAATREIRQALAFEQAFSERDAAEALARDLGVLGTP